MFPCPADSNAGNTSTSSVDTFTRQSTRIRKPPTWLTDYTTSANSITSVIDEEISSSFSCFLAAVTTNADPVRDGKRVGRNGFCKNQTRTRFYIINPNPNPKNPNYVNPNPNPSGFIRVRVYPKPEKYIYLKK